MPKYTWESIQNNPQELEKLIATIGQIDAIVSDPSDPRLKDVVAQLRSLQDNPGQENAKRIFEEGIEVVGDRLGFIKAQASKTAEVDGREEFVNEAEHKKYEQIKKLEGYQDVEDQLTLVEPDTAAFVAESVRSYAYDAYSGKLTGSGAIGVENLFFDFAALYEKVKGVEDWRNVKVSSDDLHGAEQNGPATEIGGEFGNRSAMLFLDDLPNDQKLKMLRFGKNGDEISQFLYQDYIKGAWEKLHDRQENARPGGRCFPQEYQNFNEKLSPEQVQANRERWEQNEKKRADKYTVDVVADIITCRAVAKLKPEEGKHFWDAGNFGKSTCEAVTKYVPDFIASMPRKDLCKVILKDEEGKALTDAFRKHVVTLDEIPEDLPEHLRPTAKERIEALQARIRDEEAEPEQKRRWAAEIIATREAVNAQRGGAGLDTVLTVEMCKAMPFGTDRVEANFKKIFDASEEKSFNKYIIAGALSGHGGKMMEYYRENYAIAINNDSTFNDGRFADDVDETLLPTAKQRIELMQKRLKNLVARRGRETAEREFGPGRIAVETLAEILAARENVNARRGGAGLEKQLTDSARLAAASREYADALLLLDEADLKLLEKKALSGHGGDMKETFNSPRIQEKLIPRQIDSLSGMAAKLLGKGGEKAVNGLAGILYLNMVENTDNLKTKQTMLRDENVNHGIDEFKKLPQFKDFIKEVRPEALEAAKGGQFKGLVFAWENYLSANKNKQPENKEQEKNAEKNIEKNAEQGEQEKQNVEPDKKEVEIVVG